jgi:hypothetical protein
MRTGVCEEDENYCNPDSKDSVKTQGVVGVTAGSVLLLGGAALFVVGALTGDSAEKRATRCGIGLSSAHCSFQF